MAKVKKLLLTVILLFFTITQSKADLVEYKYKSFQTRHPYAAYNIKQITLYLLAYLAMCSNIENKEHFSDASKQEKEIVTQIATTLGFSQEEISKIKVKKPRLYNNFDQMFKNNYAAFLKTLIIGRQECEELADLTKDPDVKRFIYAHELSHIKYHHSIKTFFAFVASPIITHFSVAVFNHVYKKIMKNINISYAPRKIKKAIMLLPYLLDSLVTKIFLQTTLWLGIRKQFEKQADISAATLGPKTIAGGIQFLKTIQKIQEDQKQEILKQYSNVKMKTLMYIILGIKNFVTQLWDPHPSHEKRIAYLEDMLQDNRGKF